MSAVATAIVGSAVIGGVVSSKSAKAQANAATAGMAQEERIAYENRELQRELADTQREDFAPWRDIGEQSLNQLYEGVKSGQYLPDEFKFTGMDLYKDPGYQFRMEQGVEALDKSAAARGLLLSGAQQKALTDYGQNMGSQEYANAYARYADQYTREANRRANEYNMLSALSSQGQASAAQQAGATSQLAQTEGNILSNLGRSQNISQQNIGAARASGYQQLGQSANQAAQNWLLYQNLG